MKPARLTKPEKDSPCKENCCSSETPKQLKNKKKCSSDEDSCCEQRPSQKETLQEKLKCTKKKCTDCPSDPIAATFLEICCRLCQESQGEICCETGCCGIVCCIAEALLKKKQQKQKLDIVPQNSKLGSIVEFAIQGLTCVDCTTTLEEHLSKCAGILSANVNFFSHSAKIVYDPSITSERNIPEEVKKLGYTATLLADSASGISQVQLLMQRNWNDKDAKVIKKLKSKPGVVDVQVQSDSLRPLLVIKYHSKITGPRTIMKILEALGLSTTLHQRKKKNIVAESAGAGAAKYKRLFLFSLLFSIPVVLIAFAFPLSQAIDSALETRLVGAFTIKVLVEWILTTPIQFWVAFPLYESTYRALRYSRKANMDTLVVASTTTAYIYSAVSAIIAMTDSNYPGESFFETSAILLTLIMLGRFMEISAKNRTSQTLTKLLELQPDAALLLSSNDDGQTTKEEEIDVMLLEVGDLVKVVPGAKIPIDGVVAFGISSVDEAAITGESMPSVKEKGKSVFGGSVNQDGMLHVRVTKTAEESTVAAMVKLIEQAQSSKAPIQSIGDTIAAYFVPSILALSTVVFFIWLGLSLGGVVVPDKPAFPFALQFFISLLVIACPCALALAAPTPIVVGIGVGAKLGILFKNGGEVFQQCNKVNTIIFDKTGTLTQGKPKVVSFKRLRSSSMKDEEFFFLVGSAESASEHPLAKAIVQFASERREQNLVEPKNFKAHPGKGLQCLVGETEIIIGNFAWLEENGILPKKKIKKEVSDLESMGRTVVCVVFDKELVGYLALMDTPRTEAQDVLIKLEQMKMEVWMLSGDNQRTANAIASELGISHVAGNLLPSQKAEKIRELQQQGKVVVMVGDGINDSPALTQADVGIAVSSGTDIAIEAANVVLMRDDLTSVVNAIHLAKQTFKCVYLNFAWAFLYNVVSIALAAGVFYPIKNFVIPPPIAGLAEFVSSLPVIAFSLSLYMYRAPFRQRNQLQDLP